MNIWFYCGFLGTDMFTIICIFLGSSSFPSLEIINSKNILENTMNVHLSGFKLMPYSLHFWKNNLSFYRWLSMSLYTVKSFRNIFIKLFKYFLNVLVTTFWYVGSLFFTPNGITFHIKAPQCITNVILYLSFRAIEIWWYPEYPSKKEMCLIPYYCVQHFICKR